MCRELESKVTSEKANFIQFWPFTLQRLEIFVKNSHHHLSEFCLRIYKNYQHILKKLSTNISTQIPAFRAFCKTGLLPLLLPCMIVQLYAGGWYRLGLEEGDLQGYSLHHTRQTGVKIRVVPNTDLAGYPANNFSGYRISDQKQKSRISGTTFVNIQQLIGCYTNGSLQTKDRVDSFFLHPTVQT